MKNITSFILLIFSLMLATAPALAEKSKTVAKPETDIQAPKDNSENTAASPAGAPINLDWYTINSGGASFGTSGSLKLGYSVGQSVAGAGSSASLKMGVGFWYGAVLCVAKAGDANGDGNVLLPDVIVIVNFLFHAGATPNPVCRGDANGVGGILLSDVVYLINFIFRAGPAPVKTDGCCL